MIPAYRLWRFRRNCSQLALSCKTEQLKTYLEWGKTLNPQRIDNTPMIAVDLELTGLDAEKNKIISMGWTLIDNGRIQLGSNRHLLVAADHPVGDSATIHELLDNEINAGIPIDVALGLLFEAAKGRVWVFHHAGLDVAFIQSACQRWRASVVQGKVPMLTLDTMGIELLIRQRRNLPVKPGDLQLGKLRSEYRLPDYKGHNALVDALATGELILAMAAHMEPNDGLGLMPYIRYI